VTQPANHESTLGSRRRTNQQPPKFVCCDVSFRKSGDGLIETIHESAIDSTFRIKISCSIALVSNSQPVTRGDGANFEPERADHASDVSGRSLARS